VRGPEFCLAKLKEEASDLASSAERFRFAELKKEAKESFASSANSALRNSKRSKKSLSPLRQPAAAISPGGRGLTALAKVKSSFAAAGERVEVNRLN